MSQLEARHLAKRYGQREVVSDVSLTVGSGEVVGLLGPNGAGKTTSFYMIVGLVKADRGSVSIGDQDLTKSPMHVRARAGLGYLPQEPSVFRKLNVYDNVMAICKHADLDRSNSAAKLSTFSANSKLGISKRLAVRHCPAASVAIRDCSRSGIETAVHSLDEPFAGVDHFCGWNSAYCYVSARQGIGVLITDHSVREALVFVIVVTSLMKGISSRKEVRAIAGDTRVKNLFGS